MTTVSGRLADATGLSPSAEPLRVSSAFAASIPSADLPPEVLSQLSALPEEAPEDFICVICGREASNRFHWSARHYERPPVCKSCETFTGYGWAGRARQRTSPSGGTFRDRREALRIGALADAIAEEATRQQWSKRHGRA